MEMLVVIIVLGLLLALLLPGLAGARERSRQAVCAVNLRVLAQATVVYRNENRDQIPVCNPLWNHATRLQQSVAREPFVALASQLGDPSEPWMLPSARCPSAGRINEALGVSYRYMPGDMYDLARASNPAERELRIREVQSIYRAADEFSLVWDDLDHVAHARFQGSNRALWQAVRLDGAVLQLSGEAPVDLEYWLSPPASMP